jgi:hypothetical protein
MRMKPRGGTCAHRQAVWLLANSRSASEDSSVAACTRAVKTRQNPPSSQNSSKPAEQSKHVKTRRAVRTRQTVPQLRASSAREGNAGGPGLGVCREALGVKLVLVPAQPGARVVKGGQRWSNGEVTRGRRERCFRAGHAVDEAARIHAVASAPPSHSPPKRQRNSQRLGKAESGGTSRSLRPRSRACTPRRGRRVPRGRCAGSTPQKSGVDSIRGAEVSSITGGGPK